MLQQVAERLKRCLRETDMVARFGGDEFAVLQDDVSDALSIETMAAKIRDAIAGPYTLAGSQVTTSASIGIVPYRADISDADAMMMKADLALYRAKNDGRNQYRFHVAELDAETRERISISEDLRHAVERGEFELVYQPQVDARNRCDRRARSVDPLEPSGPRPAAARAHSLASRRRPAASSPSATG